MLVEVTHNGTNVCTRVVPHAMLVVAGAATVGQCCGMVPTKCYAVRAVPLIEPLLYLVERDIAFVDRCHFGDVPKYVRCVELPRIF